MKTSTSRQFSQQNHFVVEMEVLLLDVRCYGSNCCTGNCGAFYRNNVYVSTKNVHVNIMGEFRRKYLPKLLEGEDMINNDDYTTCVWKFSSKIIKYS